MTLGGSGQDPMITIGDADTLARIERFLQSLLAPLAFVYFGARTAPCYRKIVSILLGILLVIGIAVLAYMLNLEPDIEIEHGVFQVISQMVGVAGAIYLVRRKERIENVDGTPGLIPTERGQTGE